LNRNDHPSDGLSNRRDDESTSLAVSTADPPAAADQWSFDYSTFDRFVDAVEQEPLFQDLIVTRPVRSAVYWEEA
jgi:hypothetical protein